MEPHAERMAIIGAGASGLVAARALKQAGLAFEVLERHEDTGGVWDRTNPGSPVYASAHLISSKTCSALEGFPMPEHFPDYPGHAQVLEYLRAFAEHHGLRPFIQFKTRVEKVRAVEGGWELELGTGERRRYTGLISAVGHTWIPNPPSYPGTFTGTAIHSSQYQSADEFAGKRVLIVGGGNSGCDIACDAAQRASRAFISLRRGYHFLPKHLLGKPLDAFFRSGPELPLWLGRPLLSLLLRFTVGDLQRYGLPKPDHGVLETHPIVNSQLLHHLGHGNISVKPDVQSLEGTRVRFVDGTQEELDVVVYATGYRPLIPCLSEVLPLSEAGVPDLFARMFPPGVKNVFVMGQFESDGALNPLVSRQARVIAAILRAQRSQPERYRWFEQHLAGSPPDISGGVDRIATQRHAFYAQFEAYQHYLDGLLRKLGAAPA
jgi:hypothetical protein